MTPDRCPQCGAAVAPGAPWCTLCYTDLNAAVAGSPHLPVAAADGPDVYDVTLAPLDVPVSYGAPPPMTSAPPAAAVPPATSVPPAASVDPLTAPLDALTAWPAAPAAAPVAPPSPVAVPAPAAAPVEPVEPVEPVPYTAFTVDPVASSVPDEPIPFSAFALAASGAAPAATLVRPASPRGGAVWPCPRCAAQVPLAEPACVTCGEPFLGGGEQRVRVRLPWVGDVSSLTNTQQIGVMAAGAVGIGVVLFILFAILGAIF